MECYSGKWRRGGLVGGTGSGAKCQVNYKINLKVHRSGIVRFIVVRGPGTSTPFLDNIIFSSALVLVFLAYGDECSPTRVFRLHFCCRRE